MIETVLLVIFTNNGRVTAIPFSTMDACKAAIVQIAKPFRNAGNVSYPYMACVSQTTA